MCTLWSQAPAALKRPWQGREEDEPQSGGFLQSNAPIVTRDQPVSEAGVSSRELVLCCTSLLPELNSSSTHGLAHCLMPVHAHVCRRL